MMSDDQTHKQSHNTHIIGVDPDGIPIGAYSHGEVVTISPHIAPSLTIDLIPAAKLTTKVGGGGMRLTQDNRHHTEEEKGSSSYDLHLS